MLMNFGFETDRVIQNVGQSWETVDWVGTPDFKIPIRNFREVANKTNYTYGQALQELVSDIIIVFKDGTFLEREALDTNNAWHYHRTLREPVREETITQLRCDLWRDRLATVNNIRL